MTANVVEPAAELPEIELLSMAEACAVSRLSRATLLSLLDEKSIQGFSLRRKGFTRGRRMVSKASLLAFIQASAE